jgi:methyl-accepting chemotaxis protein
MTGEEMERAVAFVLEQQAQTSSNLAQLTERVDRLADKVDRLADKVERIGDNVERMAEKIDRNADSVTALLAIAEIHEREITENREAQARTNERLNVLINTVERYISERHNGKA